MEKNDFTKSSMGAQSAWKGFSSQTMYIASMVIRDDKGHEFYPEDIEDLVIKKSGVVIEAVQVKNTSSDLTLSSLASTATSKSGEGFFKRMCSLHEKYPTFNCIKVVYFNSLGNEFMQLEKGNEHIKNTLISRLVDKHTLSVDDATWLISSLHFEKVDVDELDKIIYKQISGYVPVMAAPTLAKELLVQYISKLSYTKGFTTLNDWEEEIHNIGVNIAAIDGFYKEYNKSLICLSELKLDSDYDSLKYDFSQGVSAHPMHIRHELDFKREFWLEEIQKKINETGVALIKGVSGQGKSTLSYRYLIDTYPEGCVFCVRAIATEEQAQNLVAAIDGLGKHNEKLIIYIDVQPGETLWPVLLQELQARALNVPVLISIRDEDFNATPISGKNIMYGIVNLTLSEEEAEYIYTTITAENPHSKYITFADAWQAFGGKGPLIEFVYMLTNNQTLAQRLQEQIDALIQAGISDKWLEILELVCYAGRLGCAVDFVSVRQIIQCSDMNAAIRKFKDEYLIRITEDNKLEALHPVRAKLVYEILCKQICTAAKEVAFKVLSCVSSHSVWVILLDYFANQEYELDDVKRLADVEFEEWQGYASSIKAMIWLDVKRYVEINSDSFDAMIKKHGKGWLCFLPIDFANTDGKEELIADSMKELAIFDQEKIQESIDDVKKSLTSLHIDHQATDCFIMNARFPKTLPNNDENRKAFGYALFWMAKRGYEVNLEYNLSEIIQHTTDGEIQASADAIRGLFEHHNLHECYQKAVGTIEKRLITEMNIISYSVNESEVVCKFVPPFSNEEDSNDNGTNTNQYWRIRMLDILKQIYPNKEYINIELIGVDLLKDIGIDPIDHVLLIHKDNRHDIWKTEINGWLKTRIEYNLRPKTWDEYVSEIDTIRTSVNELITETLRLIDDLYKKGRFTQARGNRVDEKLKVFRNHTFAENRLPYAAVDPYCLYSESNVKQIATDYFPMRQLLSVGKYEKIRKGLNDVYTSLDNFYNQFSEVLVARIKSQDINTVKNLGIAMFNLYSAAKALPDFQDEYESVFAKYSSLDENFKKQELEALMTLVNVWRYVLDNAPKNVEIAYDAKQRYKKGKNYFWDTLERGMVDIGGELLEGEKYIYISTDCNTSKDNTLESEYTNVVLKLRAAFADAVSPSSYRWYVETQSKQLAYVPKYFGVYSPTAFSIPAYKLLDLDQDNIAEKMFPCEIDSVLREVVFTGGNRDIWIESMAKLGEIKIYLLRYQQMLQIEIDKKCESVFWSYKEYLIETIKVAWGKFYLSHRVTDQLLKDAESETKELLGYMNIFYAGYEEIEKCMLENNEPQEIISAIESIMGIMLLLMPKTE